MFLIGALAVPAAVCADPQNVLVSIEPQKYFVEQIGGSRIRVETVVPRAASPAAYEPKPHQMAAMAAAEAYFAIGVPFEKIWLPRFSAVNRDMRIIATDAGIDKIPMTDHEEAAGIRDPHIWLSPRRVKIQAGHIADALRKIDPEHASYYEANHRAFIQELTDLDSRIQTLLKGFEGFQFMVFHPAWGYFARDYGLQQIAVEKAGKNPKPGQVRHLIDNARRRGIRVVFVQPQFSARSARVIAREIGGRVETADPLAPDWPQNLLRFARQIAASRPEAAE